jgi:alpha-glucosidase (family GH31 glycosyl hydrolase)
MELDNIKKHCERLVKQIDFFIGNGKGKEILSDLCDVTGKETPQECAKWANDCVFSTWYTEE